MNWDDDVIELLKMEAQKRTQLHTGDASQRPLTHGFDFVGLLGEATFARMFKQPLDLERRRKGDNGIDFVVPLAFTVDVKGSRHAGHLIVEEHKVIADIYALVRVYDDNRTEPLGWERAAVIKLTPVRPSSDFGDPAGRPVHAIEAEKLRKMHELGNRIMLLTTPFKR